ncbi:glycosyltransferase family 2 protein [Parasediminibacterium paludis]|uniref:Glycosyltransferase family 2 protein n=1 Tax=Parasediminibacterium paludis TaxID=908966 RepID=A0ABV8PXQ5_9BACT
MTVIFWVSLFIIFYTYIGYGIVLYVLVRIKRLFIKPIKLVDGSFTPSLTLIVAAYNEASVIEEKIQNTLQLIYPKDKLQLIFVTDGSIDNTPTVIAQYPEIKLLHKAGRSGKINAVHRAMGEVNTEIVVFTDANTFLNENALLRIAKHYINPKVGAVSGEKRVAIEANADATAGEGFYWKYESALKKWDAELYSVVGAAGELFSVRTDLYVAVEPDTLLDDFMISMKIAMQGYKIAYDADAYAMESSSENLKEEYKRKVRIASGGIQSIIRTRKLFNPIFMPLLGFQYLSHRVLRWTITPFLMILVVFVNAYLLFDNVNWLLAIIMVGQLGFYSLAALGWLLERKEVRIKILFIPYYFCFMNYCVLVGIYRYFFTQKSSVLWDKAKRKQG